LLHPTPTDLGIAFDVFIKQKFLREFNEYKNKMLYKGEGCPYIKAFL